MQLDCPHVSGLLSLAASAGGTLVLFLTSWSLQPPVSAQWADEEMDRRITAKNAERIRWQRLGLALLLIGFFLQGVAIYCTP